MLLYWIYSDGKKKKKESDYHWPCIDIESKRRKKFSIANYYITSLSQLWYGRAWMVKKKSSYISDMQPLTIYNSNHNRQFEFTHHSQVIGIEIIWKAVKSLEENVGTTENGPTLYHNLPRGPGTTRHWRPGAAKIVLP